MVNNLPDYPSNTIGSDEYHKDRMPIRYEIAGSNTTGYGRDGEVISTDFDSSPYISMVKTINRDFADYERLSDKNFDAAIEALDQSDLFTVDRSDERFVQVTTTNKVCTNTITKYLLSK